MKQHSPCDSFSSARAKFGPALNLVSPLETTSSRGEDKSLLLRVDQQLRKQRASAIEERQPDEHTDRLANQARDTGFPDEFEQGRQQMTQTSPRASQHPPLQIWSTETPPPQRVGTSSAECTSSQQIAPAVSWETLQQIPLNVDPLTAMGPSSDGLFLQSADERADSPLDLTLDSFNENRNGRRRAIQLLPKMSVKTLQIWSTETPEPPQRVVSSVECTASQQIEPAVSWETLQQQMPLHLDLTPPCDGFFLQSPDESAHSPLDLMFDSYVENRNRRRRAYPVTSLDVD